MNKLKWFTDFEKEEKWLAEMAQKGFAMVSVNSFGKYCFKQVEPVKLNYRVDYRTFKNSADLRDYCQLFEDSGWRHFWGKKNSGTQYFVQSSDTADSDIFSDSASKAGRYKRLFDMWIATAVPFIPILTSLIITSKFKTESLTNPRIFYYTPGLWSMKGWAFWRAFLFETPFAVGRGYLWLIFVMILLLYVFLLARTFRLYLRYLKKDDSVIS